MKAIISTAIVVVFLLAGCSKPPPSGDLKATPYTLSIGGTVTSTFVAYSNPIDAMTPAPVPDLMICPEPPVPVFNCVDASTTITAELQEAPAPNSEGYHAFLVGTAPSVDLGAFVADESGLMYTLSFTRANEDLSTGHTLIQLKMGELVLAEAPVSPSGGPAQFLTAPGVIKTTATGSYSGNELTVTVGGLPGNATFMGVFYKNDETGMPVASSETCPISSGANKCVLSANGGNVADYSEFHVHVAGSKVNLVKTTIG